MGVTKLKMFAGEAEVLGEIKNFHYDGNQGVLVLHGVPTVGEAMDVLEQLSTGKLDAVRVGEIETPLHHTETDAAPNGAVNGHAHHKPEPPAAKSSGAPAPGALADAAVQAAKEEMAQEASSAGDLPESVVNAKRMLDVVSYFHGKGITDADAITAECEAIRAKVPLLGRVSNMKDRVERTLVSYFQAPAPQNG